MASADLPWANHHRASLRMEGNIGRLHNELRVMLLRWCPGQGSNLHDGITRRGILSPLCLPVSPPGLRWRDCVRKKRGAGLPSVRLEAGVGIDPASTD